MDGQVLHHEITEGTGATVVLVPGGLTGIRSLEPLVAQLAGRGYRTVAVEPLPNERGSRGEVGDGTYDADVERENLRRTIREVSPDEPVHLLGWSNGGRASLAFAAGCGELVRSVTAVEPAASWLATDPGGRELTELMLAAVGRPVTDEVLLAFLENVRVAPIGTDLRALPQWEAWRSVANTLSWYGQPVFDTAVPQLDPAAIRVPVLLARGTWTAPWLREVVDVLASQLADVRVLELEGGHACLLQDAPTLLDALDALVGSTG